MFPPCAPSSSLRFCGSGRRAKPGSAGDRLRIAATFINDVVVTHTGQHGKWGFPALSQSAAALGAQPWAT